MTSATDCPTLSVALITYNHEPFIRDALEGIMSQQVDFDWEVVVGEDCSTDRTRDIVREYADRYPHIIRILDSPKNIGAHENWFRIIAACRGEFIASLDGDDYWCTPHKLQKQVDLLRTNPDLAASFHAVRRLRADGTTDCAYPAGRRERYTFAHIAKHGCIHTSTAVMRRSAFPGFPAWFSKAPCGDWPMHLLVVANGDAGYIDEVMSAYRHHPGGAAQPWRNDRRNALKAATELRLLMIPGFEGARAADLTRALYKGYYQLAHEHMRAGDHQEARQLLRKCLSECGYDPRVDPLEPFRTMFHVWFPRVYAAARAIKGWLTPSRWRTTVTDKSPASS